MESVLPREVQLRTMFILEYPILVRMLAKLRLETGEYLIGPDDELWQKHVEWKMKESNLTAQELLIEAIKKHYTMQVATLLKYYGDDITVEDVQVEQLDDKILRISTNYDEESPLEIALSDNTEIIPLLLSYAPENIKDYLGYLVLSVGVQEGNLGLIETALDNANPDLNWFNSVNIDIFTYLLHVESEKLVQILEYLYPDGLDAIQKERLFREVLMIRDSEIFRYVLDEYDFSDTDFTYMKDLLSMITFNMSWSGDNPTFKENIRILLGYEELMSVIEAQNRGITAKLRKLANKK